MSRKRVLILICALIVLIASVGYIIFHFVSQEIAGDIYGDLQNRVDIPPVTEPTQPPTAPSTEPTEPEPSETEPSETEPTEPTETEPSNSYVSPIDFESLWGLNKDVYAWLFIPRMDTNTISYPVLQHPSDDTYYLNHTIEGMRTLPGSIYSEMWNSKDFSDRVTIIYGHNMANGTMFGSLHKFRGLTFMREHQIVSLYTPEGEYHYRIWAAVTYSSAYLPYAFDLTTEEGVAAFIQAIKNVHDINSLVDNEVPISEKDRFIVLSTCCPDNHYRLLVVGVLDEELSAQ